VLRHCEEWRQAVLPQVRRLADLAIILISVAGSVHEVTQDHQTFPLREWNSGSLEQYDVYTVSCQVRTLMNGVWTGENIERY
jgi:hypothetical protein